MLKVLFRLRKVTTGVSEKAELFLSHSYGTILCVHKKTIF